MYNHNLHIPMKTYYEQIFKIVDPVLVSYRTDLTKHDRNTLTDYKGRVLYAYRPSGTSLSCPDLFIEAFKEFLRDGKTDMLNEKSHIAILDGSFKYSDTLSAHSVVYNWGEDTRHLYGEKGKMRKSTAQELQSIVKRIDTECSFLMEDIRKKWAHKIHEFKPDYRYLSECII
jgi:hypothetical protein